MGTYIGRVVNDYMEFLPVQLVRVSSNRCSLGCDVVRLCQVRPKQTFPVSSKT